jgi:hypothetical protein
MESIEIKDSYAICPLHRQKVLVPISCEKCDFCSAFDNKFVKCKFNLKRKLASVFTNVQLRGNNPIDITKNTAKKDIALDTINRDLHEPNIEDLAEFFGFDLEEITQ